MIEAGVAGGSAAHHAEQRRTVASRLIAEAEWLDSVAHDERATSARLQELSTAHAILHDLKIEGAQGNIDHAVVGPGGAFVIITRRFAEPVTVRDGMLYAGTRSLQPELDGVKVVAARLADALGTPVVPVIGFHGGILPASAPHDVAGVHVCTVDNLVRVITRASHTLLAPHKVTEVTERALPLLFNAGSVPRTQIEAAPVVAAAPINPWIPDPARPADDAARRNEAMTILQQAAAPAAPAAAAPAAATPAAAGIPSLTPMTPTVVPSAAAPSAAAAAPTAVGSATSATSAFSPLSAAGAAPASSVPVGSVSHGTLAGSTADASAPTSLSELSQMANSLAVARAAASANETADANHAAALASQSKAGKKAEKKANKNAPKAAKPKAGKKPGADKRAKPTRSRGRTVALVLTLCVVAATAGAAYAIMQNGDDGEQSISTEPPKFTRPATTLPGAGTSVAGPMAAAVTPPVAVFTPECLAAGSGWGWVATWPGDVPNLQQYNVEIQNADGSWSMLTPLASSAVTSVSVAGQPPNTTVTLRITAVMVDGSTQVGAPAAFTTPASPC